ncbi:MAG: hypothetical protein H6737_29810 [Alphaproteobacteria bacterium]|nr:hypothetical protein [Alphaproteobacteria bacterium]
MRGYWALGLAFAVGCGPIADEREYRIEGDFTSVRVELSNGDLVVEEVEGAQVLVDADFGGVGGPGTVSRYMDGDQLVIDYACGLCGGDLEVGLPAGMPVDVVLAHGDLSLEGLSGPVTAELHAGSVEGEGLACDTTIFNHAGSIELEWDFRPVFVDAEAHLGAISLEVPAGGYQLDTHSNIGVVRLIDVFDDPESDSELHVFAHAGEVEIAGE